MAATRLHIETTAGWVISISRVVPNARLTVNSAHGTVFDFAAYTTSPFIGTARSITEHTEHVSAPVPVATEHVSAPVPVAGVADDQTRRRLIRDGTIDDEQPAQPLSVISHSARRRDRESLAYQLDRARSRTKVEAAKARALQRELEVAGAEIDRLRAAAAGFERQQRQLEAVEAERDRLRAAGADLERQQLIMDAEQVGLRRQLEVERQRQEFVAQVQNSRHESDRADRDVEITTLKAQGAELRTDVANCKEIIAEKDEELLRVKKQLEEETAAGADLQKLYDVSPLYVCQRLR